MSHNLVRSEVIYRPPKMANFRRTSRAPRTPDKSRVAACCSKGLAPAPRTTCGNSTQLRHSVKPQDSVAEELFHRAQEQELHLLQVPDDAHVARPDDRPPNISQVKTDVVDSPSRSMLVFSVIQP
ncbi:unnamed protein product [Macrosiphum euphorbiae]|uniref:Uncharacterized protein n=1 Tax=Macrosiphum euphorbiae TaxID=13131 RepID=A0AAV0WF98_9HEMI|nr:unnamed protein product [Macrosiphum euphorbiae]